MKSVLPISADCTVRLVDGRTLGYSRFGFDTAFPVFMFHGTPGSRLFTFPEGSPLETAQIQVILPERPGYGLSDYLPGRTITGWADDILQLVDQLGFEQFHIIGISGGGPYALACARLLPDRVSAVTLLASVAPLYVTQLRRGMATSNKMACYLARHLPVTIRWNFLFNRYSLTRYPDIYLRKLYKQLSGWDERLLQMPDKQQLFLKHMLEAYHSGIEGAVSDIQLLMQPWGFEIAKVSVPVTVWQGGIDGVVPPVMGQYLASQLVNCNYKSLPEAGHLLFMDNSLFSTILSAVATSAAVKV